MNCNCLTDLKGKLLDHLKQPGRFKKPVKDIEIMGVTLQVTDTNLVTRTYTEVAVELEGQKKRDRSPLMHTFCPFCGKKQEDKA
jgi:hypothetical protein